MFQRRPFHFAVTIPLLGIGLCAGAMADTLWDEDSYGDLSDDRFHPTPMPLSEGTWSLYAHSGVYGENMDIYDREYFTITLPAGTQLSQLFLMDYYGEDIAAFVGIQAGPVVTVDPDAPTPDPLLGWWLF